MRWGQDPLQAFVRARLEEDKRTEFLVEWTEKQNPIVERHSDCGGECISMRALAEIWKVHPDYDPEWSNT